MKRPTATHAIVSLAALDLRRTPDHRSELCSQLLLGETVRVLRATAGGRWLQVRNDTDGDIGWVRAWGLVPTGKGGAAAWRRRARSRVVVRHAELREGPGRGAVLGPVFLNGRLAAGRARAGHRRVVLPDGREGWLPGQALAPAATRRRAGLAERADTLMGIPYLWGGRTPMGLDCSALSQILLAEWGVALPRDADEQYRFTRRLGGEEPLPGDLIFFRSGPGRVDHVGVVLSPGGFVHARGWVRMQSYVPGNVLYDKDLGGQIAGFGRAPGGVGNPRKSA